MAQEKSMKLNKQGAEEFLKSLDEKSSPRSAFIMQAIIVSLIAHIFILFITQMLTQDNRGTKEEIVYEPLDMDMLEEEVKPAEEIPQEELKRIGELKNLIANENSERSSEAKSYRGMTKAQIDEAVMNDLKNMEAEEFARLNEGRPDYTVQSNQKGKAGDQTEKKKSEYDWYRDKSNTKSYQGRVTAAYNMKGRDAIDNPVPTYRCKTQGTVVVNITINNLGQVTAAEINDAKSTVDDCLRIESEKYALKWKFDYKADAQKKQDGTITFTFSAQ